jgi:hypothetical protein
VGVDIVGEVVCGKLTSTQEPQVMPSIRSSHFTVFPMGVPRGSVFRRGSSILPCEVAEASLYQRPEKAEERADMVGVEGYSWWWYKDKLK